MSTHNASNPPFPADHEDQKRFDALFVGSDELMRECGASRKQLHYAIYNNILPPPINQGSGHRMLWFRDRIRESAEKWKISLEVRNRPRL
jgi:hypothetical protein